ncbi:tlde1 domain-containing protein [Rhodanobacter glycinis]|jgi:hypothetical protein|uniref:Tlde1 domain-containing protein n=2 Tax=Rhodanobacter TaxID=75309 RepID=A0A1I4G868_9GAMM|nr:tlde1 domain-containing protein [Rhodanobacter glycinis]EIL96822.1 hypothetical protein UU5_06088 [Rhodanobacter sp. 115]TAM24697.1 MAG: DUF2778 domain-containing protein [Rhodanobacter sp.]SFL26268.1 Protein of unknown function [Rhodanobacter glycinis]
MTWTYHQSTGVIDHDGMNVGTGYAGKGKCRNVPHAQIHSKEGPLPQGRYTIASHFVDDSAAGKNSLRLTHDSKNRMYGRSRFLIHGDDSGHVGDSSEGGIVASYNIRQLMLHSGDKALVVVP